MVPEDRIGAKILISLLEWSRAAFEADEAADNLSYQQPQLYVRHILEAHPHCGAHEGRRIWMWSRRRRGIIQTGRAYGSESHFTSKYN